MTEDFFALLGEPRRPWLDPEEVKEAFHRLSRLLHPDQQAEANADFARLNQAQASLREPKSRLRHLLELEYSEVKLSGPASVPPHLTDWFMPVHGLLGETDALLKKKAGASGALARSLLAREEFAVREKIEVVFEQLSALLAAVGDELQAFDSRWMAARPPDAGAVLHDFYQRFAYLSRWIDQLREHLFQLGT